MSRKIKENDALSEPEVRRKVLIVDTRQAIIGGVLAALISMVGVILPGRITNFEARGLLEAMMPSVHFLSSSVMTASATIMALMLTREYSVIQWA